MAQWTKLSSESSSETPNYQTTSTEDDNDDSSSKLYVLPREDSGNATTSSSSSSTTLLIKNRLQRQKSCDSQRSISDHQLHQPDGLLAARSSNSSINSNSYTRRKSGEDLVQILLNDDAGNNRVLARGYENEIAYGDDHYSLAGGLCDETLRILSEQERDRGRRDSPAAAQQIRKLAKEEQVEHGNQETNGNPRRPMSLYGSLRLKNIFSDKGKDTASLFDSADKDEPIKSNGKLTGNGNGPPKDSAKANHRVQFNRSNDSAAKSANQRSNQLRVDKPGSSLSESSTSSSTDDNNSFDQFSEARPPDGGWGWVVVAASFMVNLIGDGIVFSFGVLYIEFLHYFGGGKAKTSLIGSVFMAMPLLSGPIASFLTDRYGCRKVTIAGSLLSTLGFVLSSISNSLEVMLLTFGILAGFGLSLCFVAAVVIVAYYFDKRRSFATGLSVCGSGIGTFLFAPLTDYLVHEYGWRGTMLILAGFFLNLTICGCLMRDLEWTTIKAKERRIRNRERRRMAQHSSSGDSFSGSSSVNTATHAQNQVVQVASATATNYSNPYAVSNEVFRNQEPDRGEKLFSSLFDLPTFVHNDEHVPIEVLELLSAKRNIYNVLLQNYPNLLISSRSLSDSSGLHEPINSPASGSKFVPVPSPLMIDYQNPELTSSNRNDPPTEDPEVGQPAWIRKSTHRGAATRRRRASVSEPVRRLPPSSAYLKDIRIHRHSLTYRGAMLNINRYRLRASSCPDIYRNSMTTIAKTKMVWYSGIWEFWDLIVDMLDFSHFADKRFLLFAVSNFLLHAWYDVPYMYIADNALEMGFDSEQSSYLVSVIGIMNMFGEIILGWAGDRAWVNPSLIYGLCMILCGGVTSLIPVVIKNYYLLCVVSGAFGMFIAANYSLTSIILVEVISLERFANAYGLLLLVQGISNLLGPPLAGWLYDITGTYNLSFYLAGCIISLSGLMMMAMPLMDFCRYLKCRWSKDPKEGKFNNINSV